MYIWKSISSLVTEGNEAVYALPVMCRNLPCSGLALAELGGTSTTSFEAWAERRGYCCVGTAIVLASEVMSVRMSGRSMTGGRNFHRR